MMAMYFPKFFSILFFIILLGGCGSNSEKKSNNFSIETNTKNNTLNNNESLNLSIKNKKNLTIQSVEYKLNGKSINDTHNLSNSKLGRHTIEAIILYDEGKTEKATTSIVILNAQAPKIYGYKVLNEYPHDITSYTQGLEFYNGELYESTGQYGKSKLRKVDYKTGEILQNVDLDKVYFGEGVSVLNEKVFQLTWKSGNGFVYDLNLEKTGTFKYNQSKEGWGLCNDGNMLWKSDGTEKIWILNPETLSEIDYIQAYTNKGKISNLNELEWVNGKIYANRYQKNGVAIINPENGAIEGVIDFSPLKDKVAQHAGLDVLNGIAFNPDTKTIFVTGKHWNKLFEVEIVEK
jgi:glutamine cyclotransferase